MASLYELSEQMQELTQMLECGDIDQQTFNDTVEAMGVYDKVENIVKYIKNLSAEEVALIEEAKKLSVRAKTTSNKIASLKDYLLFFMNQHDYKKFDAGIFKITKSAGKNSLNITDANSIPKEYFVEQLPKLNNKALTEDIKAGMEIDGAELKKTPYILIK